MSLTRIESQTRPSTEPGTRPGTRPTDPAGWRVFTDAEARRDAIAADLALELAADLLDGDL